MPEQNGSTYFVYKAHHRHSVLRNSSQPFSRTQEGHFKQNYQEKAKHVAINKLQKGHLFTVGELKQKASVALFDLSGKGIPPRENSKFPYLCMLASDLKVPHVFMGQAGEEGWGVST